MRNITESRGTVIPHGEPTEFQKMFNQHLNEKPLWGGQLPTETAEKTSSPPTLICTPFPI